MLQSHIQSVVSIPSYTATLLQLSCTHPPPPSLRGGGGSSRSWCRLGGEAAGAGVLCITQELHSPLTPHPSPYHIITSPHHHITCGASRGGGGPGPRWPCPRTHLRASPCCACLPEQLSATTAPCSRQPGQPGTLGRILLAECSRTQPPQLAS